MKAKISRQRFDYLGESVGDPEIYDDAQLIHLDPRGRQCGEGYVLYPTTDTCRRHLTMQATTVQILDGRIHLEGFVHEDPDSGAKTSSFTRERWVVMS